MGSEPAGESLPVTTDFKSFLPHFTERHVNLRSVPTIPTDMRLVLPYEYFFATAFALHCLKQVRHAIAPKPQLVLAGIK